MKALCANRTQCIYYFIFSGERRKISRSVEAKEKVEEDENTNFFEIARLPKFSSILISRTKMKNNINAERKKHPSMRLKVENGNATKEYIEHLNRSAAITKHNRIVLLQSVFDMCVCVHS